MSVGSEAFKKLQDLKSQELTDYYTMHEDILKPFLIMQKEYRELGNRHHNAQMNSVDELLRTHKPRTYTRAELDEQLRMVKDIAGKGKKSRY